jgi:MFS family permease
MMFVMVGCFVLAFIYIRRERLKREKGIREKNKEVLAQVERDRKTNWLFLITLVIFGFVYANDQKAGDSLVLGFMFFVGSLLSFFSIIHYLFFTIPFHRRLKKSKKIKPRMSLGAHIASFYIWIAILAIMIRAFFTDYPEHFVKHIIILVVALIFAVGYFFTIAGDKIKKASMDNIKKGLRDFRNSKKVTGGSGNSIPGSVA